MRICKECKKAFEEIPFMTSDLCLGCKLVEDSAMDLIRRDFVKE